MLDNPHKWLLVSRPEGIRSKDFNATSLRLSNCVLGCHSQTPPIPKNHG